MTKAPEKAKAADKPKPAVKAADKPHQAAKAADTPKPAAKAAPKGKAVAKSKAGNKPNALQQPLQPSADLAAIIGEGTVARGEMVSKVWEYIKANKLQSPDDGRQILADAKLEKVLGKKSVSMFEMNKLLSPHLTSPK